MSNVKGQEETELGLPHISDEFIEKKRIEETVEGIKNQLLTQGYDALPDPHETLFAMISSTHGADQSEDPSPRSIKPRIHTVARRPDPPKIHLPQLSTQAIQSDLKTPSYSQLSIFQKRRSLSQVWRPSSHSSDLESMTLEHMTPPILASPSVTEPTESLNNDCDLTLKEILGVGGEGYVQMAVQESLNRHIAVKRILGDWSHSKKIKNLISEARLAGALEHPNIIPIHMLAQTSEGEVLLLMKRVEGASLSTQLKTIGPLWHKDKADVLGRYLTLFLSVCRAVEYAHSRGILHLDIKPDNIMIGDYGEVYLVDWGIAEHERDIPNLPEGQIAGTPHFMASEMVFDKRSTTQLSDVALLGTTLHTLLMGEMRYQGGDILEVMMHAKDAHPFKYPKGVHKELGAIINKACAKDPQDRFSSVAALRLSLEGYLEHRISFDLVQEGETILQELLKILRETRDEESKINSDHFRELALTCRVTFERALHIWSENWTAQIGLDQLFSCWAEFELKQGQVSVAETLIKALLSAPPQLNKALALARKKQESQSLATEKLREIERVLSFRSTSKYHKFSLILNGIFWSSAMWVISALNQRGTLLFDQQMNLELSTYAGVISLISIGLFWSLFTDTLWRKRFTFAFLGYLVIMYLNRVISIQIGLPIEHSLPIDGLLFTLFMIQLSSLIHPLMWISALICMGVTFGALFWPHWAIDLLGFAVLSANLCLAFVLGSPIDVGAPTSIIGDPQPDS
jgi:eukaryotic-like serine/threonine-protein kinase